MKQSNASTVTAYIADQPPASRAALRTVRRAIRTALPGAEESISYRMPAYRLQGRAVVYFAAWKEHYSLYPASRAVVAALGDALAGCEISGSTLRLSYARPVPVALVQAFARLRSREATAQARVPSTRR